MKKSSQKPASTPTVQEALRVDVARQLRQWGEDQLLDDSVRAECVRLAARIVPPPLPPPRAGRPVRTFKQAVAYVVAGRMVPEGDAREGVRNWYCWRLARNYEDMRGGDVVEFVHGTFFNGFKAYTPADIDKELKEEYNDWSDEEGTYDLRDELDEFFKEDK